MGLFDKKDCEVCDDKTIKPERNIPELVYGPPASFGPGEAIGTFNGSEIVGMKPGMADEPIASKGNDDNWECPACLGKNNGGKFCKHCGNPRP